MVSYILRRILSTLARDGYRRAVRLQPALHRAGRSGRGDRRRPGEPRRRRADTPGSRARPAVSDPVRVLALEYPAWRSRHLDLHQPAGLRDDRAAHRADTLADGDHARPDHPCRGAARRGGGVEGGKLGRPHHHGVRRVRLLAAGLCRRIRACLCVRAAVRMASRAGLHAVQVRSLAVAAEPHSSRAGARLASTSR